MENHKGDQHPPPPPLNVLGSQLLPANPFDCVIAHIGARLLNDKELARTPGSPRRPTAAAKPEPVESEVGLRVPLEDASIDCLACPSLHELVLTWDNFSTSCST
jgi:hypothetical protein